MSQELFWIYNPLKLIDFNKITVLWPTSDMNYVEKLNTITKLIILLTILGFIVTENYRFLLTGIITVFCIIVLYFFDLKKKEGYSEIPDEPILEKKDNTVPTQNNPAMNVLLPEYKNNINRGEALKYDDNVNEEISNKTKDFIVNQTFKNENVRDKLFTELGDSFNFDQSMRNWVVNPNTSIPNDQTAFLKYCYGDMKSCKEERATCIEGSRYSNQGIMDAFIKKDSD